jgi:TolB-like protein/DNA-binding winged helix-turn-helix (wHTH) protein/tetratricopeptide (TPR) repeat protein
MPVTDRIEPAEAITVINLAAMADFDIAELRVQPSRRTVGAGGREALVEPRVMQVLITLAEAGGAVVSRDTLIARCWGGRIVGEDAINRCIAKVRRLADMAEPAAFTIETIAKVGYRMQFSRGPRGVAPAMSPAAPAPSSPGTLSTGPKSAGLVFHGRASPEPASPGRGRDGGPMADTSLDAQNGQVMAGPPGAGALGWRKPGIAACVVILAVACSVMTWRSAVPVIRMPAPGAPTAGEPVSPPQAWTPASPFNSAPRTVAVLAFANMSNDPAQEYLADGLSEALIDVLSRVDQLRVTARTSSFTFKGRAATIQEIGRTLNVGAVLEGSLRKQGTHLRIDAHLSDARTGFPLWSQTYDRRTTDMLSLQDEIAGDVAEALQVKLVDTDAAGRRLGGTTNPLAFDAYLRGEQHVREMADGADAALAEFRTAIALDPNFALALSRLAFVLVMISGHGANDDTYRAMMAEARQAAERAVALAPGSGMAHANLAMVLRNEATDMTAAWIEAGRARALAPGSAIVETQFAQIATLVGRSEEAIAAANGAAALDPLRAESWRARADAFECARQYDAARAAVKRSMTLTSHPQRSDLDDLGVLALKQGKMDDARRICAEVGDHGCLAIAEHALGLRAEADKNMAMMMSNMGVSGAYNYSEVYAQWHEPELVRQWLTKAREINDPALSFIKCDVFEDPMRGQPWFRQIEDTLHFPPSDTGAP